MEKVCFSVPPNIFLADYKNQIVILDITKNEYLTLTGELRKSFIIALSYEFFFINQIYYISNLRNKVCEIEDLDETQHLNLNIHLLLKKNLLRLNNNPKNAPKIATALLPIGLSQAEWRPTKRLGRTNVSYLVIAEALLALAKAHFYLKRGKLEKLINYIKKKANKYHDLLSEASIEDLETLACSLDVACTFYFRKTLCLAWASAFALLLIKHRKHAELVIGVQTTPFDAHAWIEARGKVINDNAEVQERLAPIFRLAF